MSNQTREAVKPKTESKLALTKADIRAQKTLRLQLCGQAIKQILEQYECDLVAVPIIEGGKIDAKVDLVLK